MILIIEVMKYRFNGGYMKSAYYSIISIILCSLILSGCGKSENKEAASPTVSVAPETGLTLMIAASDLFKKAVDAKDAVQAKQAASQLEKAWASFEDEIKPKYPEDYLKIESSLEPLTSGVNQAAPDFTILNTLNVELNAALQQLRSDLSGGKGAVDSKALENSAELQTATKAYIGYVNEQGEQMVTELEKLVTAIAANDLKKAQAQYVQSRLPYERIEPIIETFKALDEVMDARVDDFDSETDPQFTGYHRIEHILFVQKTINGAKPFADELLANSKKMRDSIQTAVIAPADFVTGVGELMEEAQTKKITGEEERWSDASLPILRANVEGAQKIYTLVENELKKKDEALNEQISLSLSKVLQQLDTLSPEGSQWTSYGKLTQAQIIDLKNKLEAVFMAQIRQVLLHQARSLFAWRLLMSPRIT
jgi:iron uptake system component EfeO